MIKQSAANKLIVGKKTQFYFYKYSLRNFICISHIYSIRNFTGPFIEFFTIFDNMVFDSSKTGG